MSFKPQEQRWVEALPGYVPEIGRWLWALEDTRQRTKRSLEGLQPAILDWTASPTTDSIGTLLYHIAAIEIDWLYVEVLEQEFPAGVVSLFPYDVRDADGSLTPVRHLTLEEHMRRLDTTRTFLLTAFRGLAVEEFRRLRCFADYAVTPEWVLHHLMQHEAEHRGQIGELRARAEAAA